MTEEADRPVRRLKELGDLQDLLLKAAPPGTEGKLPSITTLAAALGCANWAVYLWIKKGRVPPNRVKRIVEVAEGRVAFEDFHPYTYH